MVNLRNVTLLHRVMLVFQPVEIESIYFMTPDNVVSFFFVFLPCKRVIIQLQ